jgi:hypothetical protein
MTNVVAPACLGPTEVVLRSDGAGGGTILAGGTVRRERAKAPPNMVSVLDYLERVGFDAAPRCLGTDEHDRVVLSFVPGETASSAGADGWCTSTRALVSVARLLRRYHDVMASFDGPLGPPRHGHPRAPAAFAGELVCHLDVSLDNVIFRGGEAVALIDFELVDEAAAIWDVARAARHWVPLLDPNDINRRGLADVGRLAQRLRLFADAYALSDLDRSRLIDAVLANADLTFEHMRDMALAGHAGYLREWRGGRGARNRRARAFIERERGTFERALASWNVGRRT